ncbi:MAG: ABC-type transport auxiliary lipoprotein family protein [Campylobacterales bacterium]|nr:ABC-type transport auxiliary lipoprotein family protein [Campylobacterales bacterium]
MKNLFYLLIVVLISGCSLKQEVDINSYSIDFNPKNSSYRNIGKSILIEEPLVNKSFNSRAIFYSTKPYSFEEYAKNRWINIPSNMIQNSLLETLQSSNIFSLVLQEDAKIKYDYLLKTNVIKIYHEINVDKSYVILKVKFDLLKDKELVKTFTYDRKVLVSQNKPYEFVNSLNKTFDEVIQELLKEISKL